MALLSPGVEVTIIDESQYLPAATNSVPLVLLATAQNKTNAAGTGVAAATTAANANKMFLVTSQRDLVNLYGTPFFYTSTNGTPIQGYELNEYGLLAAYSLLGVTNRCYVLRANIDLASLVGTTSRPVGRPTGGTYWLNSSTTQWGIYEFNSSTGSFTIQTPIVITDPDDLTGGFPNPSLGSIGSYAVNAIQITGDPSDSTNKQFFYKNNSNQWVVLGSASWRNSVPTIIGTSSNATGITGDLIISLSGASGITVTPSGSDIADVAAAINALGYAEVTAEVRSGKLCIFSNQTLSTSNPPSIEITGTGNMLAKIGIPAATYYQVGMAWGTSAQMPLWTSSQLYPRPTGSVWMKVGSTGVGLNPVVSQYSSSTQTWLSKPVTCYTSDWAATAAKDSTGGQAIPAGTLYAQYSFDGTTTSPSSAGVMSSPVYIWERAATGDTVVTSSDTSPTFTANTTFRMNIYVSEAGSATLSNAYPFTFTTGSSPTATDFVTAWQTAGVPNTTAEVDSDGAIVLSHLDGGEIILDDHLTSDFTTFTASNGLINDAGFVIGTTDKVKYGPQLNPTFTIAQSGGNVSTPTGTGATFSIGIKDGSYTVTIPPGSGGTGYSVNDPIVIDGSVLGGTDLLNTLSLEVTSVSGSAISGVAIVSGTPVSAFMTQLSNWVSIEYDSQSTAPVSQPANNTNWFYSVVDQVDIMVQKGGAWIGYRNTSYDSTGAPAASGVNATDPNGPIISATAPTTQSDGTTSLAYGDIWINTNDLENYPVIYRWELVNGESQWVLINDTDQVSSRGIVFADARWGTSGSVDPVNDPIPTIKSLLTSNYIDLGCPDASLYPQGMLLFNTRRSGYNVKQFRVNYFNSTTFPDETLPAETNAWVTVSGNQSNGAPYMGRKAQRAMVVKALQSSIDTNTDIRDEDNYFNLLATPNYPELITNMIALNADRGETGYIIGDTPMRLPDSATAIEAWAKNTANAAQTGDQGLTSSARNTYVGLFYPSGYTNDLSGNQVVVPPSHMMLRTFLRNDAIAYPWLAAAGTRRGNVDNALSIGYLDATTQEFVPTKTRLGIRDVLYTNQINPIVQFTGVGLLNYGNKNSKDTQSALDRTNVSRLVAYLRRQLTLAARDFVFEPNDAITRQSISGVIQTLMVDLVAKRGIYDYLVVCDESNNTPARIDRNELWVDVAIEPVKAAEFIYIPVRILNTGEIGNNAGQTVLGQQ